MIHFETDKKRIEILGEKMKLHWCFLIFFECDITAKNASEINKMLKWLMMKNNRCAVYNDRVIVFGRLCLTTVAKVKPKRSLHTYQFNLRCSLVTLLYKPLKNIQSWSTPRPPHDPLCSNAVHNCLFCQQVHEYNHVNR